MTMMTMTTMIITTVTILILTIIMVMITRMSIIMTLIMKHSGMNGIGGSRDGGFVDLKRKATATARLDTVTANCAEGDNEGDKKGEYDMVVVSRFVDSNTAEGEGEGEDEDDFLDKYEGTFSKDKMCIEEKDLDEEEGGGGGEGGLGGMGGRIGAGRDTEGGNLSPLTPPRTSSGLIKGDKGDEGEGEGEGEGERMNGSNSTYLAALALTSGRGSGSGRGTSSSGALGGSDSDSDRHLPNVITVPSTYAMYGKKIASAGSATKGTQCFIYLF